MYDLLGSMFKVVNGNTVASTHDIEQVLVNNEYYPISGAFVNVKGAERVHVLIKLGDLADAITFSLYEVEAIGGTPDALSTTYYQHTCEATDDGEFVVITLETSRMTAGHNFLTTKVGSVSGNNYASITYLLDMGNDPPTSTALPSASQHYYTG